MPNCRYAVFAKVSPVLPASNAKAVSEDKKSIQLVRDALADIHDQLIKTEEKLYSVVKGRVFQTGKSRYFNAYKDLRECACEKGQFDRVSFPRRAKIEDTIIAEAKYRFPSAPEGRVINYLSFGAGYLLQDFFLCMKLLAEGYSLNIYLIETNNKSEGFNKAYAFFVAELAKYSALLKKLIVIEHYCSVNDYQIKYPTAEVHVAHAIDYSSSKYAKHQDDPQIALIKQLVGGKGIFYIFENITSVDEKKPPIDVVAVKPEFGCTLM